LLDTFENDMNHRFREALYDNDLYRWAPQCPVRLGYCTADELVSYKNALVCQDSMIARGAPDVQAVCVNPSLSHGDCALFALMGVNIFFEPFREDIIDLSLTTTHNTSAGSNDGSIVTNINGGVPGYTYSWSNAATTANLSNIGTGTYSVTITDNNGCTASATANIGVIGIEEEELLAINIYPNPATEQFIITLSNFSDAATLSIIDLVGKETLHRKIPAGTTQVTIHTSSITKGVYLVKITSGNKVLTRRIVIN
jgi:hypothetical protein